MESSGHEPSKRALPSCWAIGVRTNVGLNGRSQIGSGKSCRFSTSPAVRSIHARGSVRSCVSRYARANDGDIRRRRGLHEPDRGRPVWLNTLHGHPEHRVGQRCATLCSADKIRWERAGNGGQSVRVTSPNLDWIPLGPLTLRDVQSVLKPVCQPS